MAQGPIDYTSGFGQQSPFGGAVEAMQAGARFGVLEQQRAGLQHQQMMREQQMMEAQAERERQGQLGAEIDAALADPNTPRAVFDRLALRAGEKPGNALIEAFKARTAEQQGKDLAFIDRGAVGRRAGGRGAKLRPRE